jgi:CheY-like chemotaxis protein
VTLGNIAISRALIVDDAPEVRGYLRALLGRFGVTKIIEAADGGEAIAALQSEGADILITDWMMDVVDGLECIRRIRAGIDGIDPHIPIILLTGVTDKAAAHAAYAAGAGQFLRKPFAPEELFKPALMPCTGSKKKTKRACLIP